MGNRSNEAEVKEKLGKKYVGQHNESNVYQSHNHLNLALHIFVLAVLVVGVFWRIVRLKTTKN